MASTESIKLFISYRSLDSAKVDALVSRLRTLKKTDGGLRYQIWQDKTGIPPGVDWWSAIVDAITDCDVFVFMVSHESVQNPNCRAELNYARKRNRPLIPLVIEGEFTFNPVTGKNDIDYWANVPEDLTEGRPQFLFYEGVSFVQQIDNGLTRLNLASHRWDDIPADRPPDPRPATDANSDSTALYNQACDYAFRAEFATADKIFRRLMGSTDSGFNNESREWVLILGEYTKLVRWNERESTRFRVQPGWDKYIKRFPLPFLLFFDPQNIQASLTNPRSTYVPPKSPKNAARVPTQGQSKESNRATGRTLLPIAIGIVAVVTLVIAIGGIGSGLFNRPSLTATATTVPAMVIIAPTNAPSVTPAPPSSTAIAIILPSSTLIPTDTPTPILTLVTLASPSVSPTVFTVSSPTRVIQNAYLYSTVPAGQYTDQWGSTTDSFRIGTFDVTNAQYVPFLSKRGGTAIDGTGTPFIPDQSDPRSHLQHPSDSIWQIEPGFENYPMVDVTWAGAEAFCESIDARLPTASERDKAAAWRADGSFGTLYPWGSEPPTIKRANFNNLLGGPSSVDAYPNGHSTVGAYDLAGNVANWTSTYNGTNVIILGGSFSSLAAELLIGVSTGSLPQQSTIETGFRCAQ